MQPSQQCTLSLEPPINVWSSAQWLQWGGREGGREGERSWPSVCVRPAQIAAKCPGLCLKLLSDLAGFGLKRAVSG
eukprot:2743289-Rhodomonas_salina.1